jgi:hypothetical protein
MLAKQDGQLAPLRRIANERPQVLRRHQPQASRQIKEKQPREPAGSRRRRPPPRVAHGHAVIRPVQIRRHELHGQPAQEERVGQRHTQVQKGLGKLTVHRMVNPG